MSFPISASIASWQMYVTGETVLITNILLTEETCFGFKTWRRQTNGAISRWFGAWILPITGNVLGKAAGRK